jgi:RNA 3'-terminal phosphate cyclase (ATP)
MIEIDGSFGEGGGQILRSSLALAAVLGKEVRIFNIRAGRSEPGLRAQHLTGAKAVANLCNASYQGLEIGSTEFAFRPGSIEGGKFRFDVGTAGSITLVLQALLPLLPFASREVTLEIRGGTDVKWSPPIDYLRLVTMPMLEKMGAEVSLQVVTRGHYPKGGGVVKVSSVPSGSLKPVVGLEGGRVNSIVGVSHAVKLPAHVAERQATAAVHLIRQKGLPGPEIEIQFSENSSHLGPGSGIVLAARLENSSIVGGDCLGEKGKLAEEIGRVAALALLEEIERGSFLDRHMGDMIVPYLALAEGFSDVSVSQITQHTLTNVRVAETVAGVQFDPVADLGRPSRLRVNGLGVTRGAVGASPREPRPILGS